MSSFEPVTATFSAFTTTSTKSPGLAVDVGVYCGLPFPRSVSAIRRQQAAERLPLGVEPLALDLSGLAVYVFIIEKEGDSVLAGAGF